MLTRPDVDRGDPRRVPRGRRRHHRDQHVQRDPRSRRPTTSCEPVVYELNLAGGAPRARGRRRVDRSGRPTGRASSPARSARPTARCRSRPTSTIPAFRAVTFDEVRDAYAEQVRGAGRRRRRPPARRDRSSTRSTLKACLVAIEEVFDETRRAPAADDLGHHHRQERPHALGPDRRGLLDLDRARAAASASASTARSARARCGRTSRSSRRRRRRPTSAATRTPACPTPSAGTTRRRRRPRGCSREFADSGPGQHRRRLLRHDARPHPRHRRGGRRASPPRACRRRAARSPQLQRPRAADHPARQQLHHDRRAHQRHRLARSSPSSSRAATTRPPLEVALEQVRGGANILDVNMDEGMLDAEAAMTRFLNLLAAEPEIARLPIMVDSSKWSVHRGGAEVRAGQGRSSTRSASRKARRTSSHKARARPALRRRRGRDGLRRGRARPTPSSARSRSASAPTTCSPSRSASPAGHHLRPEHPRRRHRHRGAQRLRDQLHRGDARSSSRRCPGAKISGGVSNLSFSFRGNDVGARGDALGVPLPRDPGRPGHGHRQRRPARASTRRSRTELLERVEDVLFNRRPDATERLVEFAETVKGKGKKRELDLAWRERTGRGAARARAGARHRRLHRGRHRGGAAEVRAPARRHRRPADGRHEHRRRPVRRRQDVPAAGGEERARDEEGGRLPDAVHGGGEGATGGTQRRRARS